MEVNYKRCKSSVAAGLRFPVYAGEDGSIVAYNTSKSCWQQLKQTYDHTNGYWVTSVPKANPAKHEKRRSEIDVHTLVCRTWKGEPMPLKTRVDHINGDSDDNSEANLDWVDALGNSANTRERSLHFPPDFSHIVINCGKLHRGLSVLDVVTIRKVDGTYLKPVDIFGPQKGRSLKRLCSLLGKLSKSSELRPEKAKRRIENQNVIFRDDTVLPDEIKVIR